MIYFMQKYYRFENSLIFIICILLYLMKMLIFQNVNNSTLHYFFTCYFDDLLAPLLLFSYTNLLISFIDKKIYSFRYLIILILIFSCICEYLVPFIKPTSVSDPIDMMFYVLGTLIYWIIHQNWMHNKLNNQISLKNKEII